MTCPCGLGEVISGSSLTNATFWMQELQNSHDSHVVFCWSLIAPLRKTFIFLKYNHHTEARLWGKWWFCSTSMISTFSVDKATTTTMQLVLLLCSACTFMFSVHRSWQETQSLDHSGSKTVEWIVLKIIWTDWLPYLKMLSTVFCLEANHVTQHVHHLLCNAAPICGLRNLLVLMVERKIRMQPGKHSFPK